MKANEEATFPIDCRSKFAIAGPTAFAPRASARRPCTPNPRFAGPLIHLDRRRLRGTRQRITEGTPAGASLPVPPHALRKVGSSGTPTAFFYVITLMMSVPLVDIVVRFCGF